MTSASMKDSPSLLWNCSKDKLSIVESEDNLWELRNGSPSESKSRRVCTRRTKKESFTATSSQQILLLLAKVKQRSWISVWRNLFLLLPSAASSASEMNAIKTYQDRRMIGISRQPP